ncbi:hypothetical protein [Micromonospora sp. NPDC007220]|uniref:hypothetical protein n=1 Tax=Micromonospora sp. NPDC007220 TaxID=3154318 RepID=UPI0033D2F5E9
MTPTQEQINRMKTVTGGIHVGTGLQDWLIGIAPNSLARTENWRPAGVDVTEHNINGVHVWDVWRQMLDDYLRAVAFRTTTSLEVDTTSAGNPHRTHVTATAEVDPVTISNRAPSGTVDFYAGAKYLGSGAVGGGRRLTPTPRHGNTCAGSA